MPVVAFVLVVAVAMACAVWSPLQYKGGIAEAGIAEYSASPEVGLPIPRALSMYDAEVLVVNEMVGFGISHSYLVIDPQPITSTAQPPHSGIFWIGRVGFPLRCLRWTFDQLNGVWSTPSMAQGIGVKRASDPSAVLRRIPLMPEPVGMALNVLIYSVAIMLVRLGWRRAVASRRKRKSLCSKCAYPLGDFTACPECGNPTGRDA